MSLKLVKFGTYAGTMTTLPILERTHEQGSGASRIVMVDIPDGQSDLLGNEKARRAPFSITHNCILHDTTPVGLQAQLDAWRALRGKRDKLWMEETSGALRWAWARLDSVSGQNSQRTPLYIPMAITFLVISQVWNGEEHGWYFDDGHYFDEGLYFNAGLSYVLSSNPMTITVPNSGNVDVENPSITITAKSSNITALTLKRIVGGVTQEHLEYTGTILVDDDLVIDCGSYSVENDGVGDSAHFSRGADHKYDGWMKLEPGNNPIQITRTGGGFDSIADFNFNDAHA